MNPCQPLPFHHADLDRSIPIRFQQVLQQLPRDQLAFVSATETLTYQELAAASQAVTAAVLARLGPAYTRAEQQAVALLLPHAAASLIGSMGVLQAGHFFVPLDLLMGAATLQKILLDCPPQVVVTTAALQPQLAQLLPPHLTPPVLCIETMLGCAATAVAPLPCDPQLYASIQYTSGSTGTPRGVIRTHATHLNTSHLCYTLSHIAPGDRVSHLFSYSLAMSNTSVFGGLLNGKTLYAYRLAEMTPLTLYEWVAENQINSLRVSIGMLRGLAALAETHPPLPSLRVIDSGGEVMRRPEVEQLCRLLPTGSKLVLRLASTEAGSYAHFMIEAGKPWHGEHTAVGTLTLNNQVLIVDENRQPVAVGQSGEIAVRSHFLAAGYWQRPAETAAKFLPDPDDCYLQTFFTGDTGRLLADGQLEFLGRTDFMVKVRGYRVQLEEVEAALTALPPIDEAVVVAWAARSGEKQLVAYYTTTDALAPTASDLRYALLQRLPDYMIPARFVVVEKVPRGSTGKVDRAALPPPGAARPDLATPFVVPQNEQEQQIADLWAELLELDEVGVEDNFFELGGDSLSLLRMSTLLSQRFDYTIPTRYYTMPTIRHLAQGLTEATADLPATMPTEPAAAYTPQRVELKQPRVLPYSEGLYPPTRWGKAFIQRGPTYAGLKLPYALGITLQRTIVQQTLIRQHFFPKQCELLGQALREAGLASQAEAITLNLMANSWKVWRGQALQVAPTFARWVAIKGDEHLKAGLARGNGLIVVFTHQALIAHLTRRVLAAHDIQPVPVIAATRPGTDGASMAVRGFRQGQEGLELLRRGQAILIAGEGREGTDPVSISLYGRRLPLPRGFAILAQISQAAVVAAFGSMNTTGHITLEFAPLPTPGPTDAVEDWVEQYGAQLTVRWPRLLSMTGWPRLAYLATLPVQQKNYVTVKV